MKIQGGSSWNLKEESWSFQTMEEVNKASSSLLRMAMFNERSRRWPKVADSYRRLLWLVDRLHFPREYQPPSSHSMLLYELHYHLAVALQRVSQQRKAVDHLTEAINIVSIPKGGCLAGCVTNSCLMTPVYARRAFAYTKIGDLRSALRDAEKAVVLDSQNPDVYCIRALVRGSRDEEALAVKDADSALKLNPAHLCALVIRGALTRSLAEKLNPESRAFNTVVNFHHPDILDFYDRFLFTLSVPHTITEIDLTPDKPSKMQMDFQHHQNSLSPSRASWSTNSCTLQRPHAEPFRCGTPSSGDSLATARRRKDYGTAVRKYLAKSQTAAEYIASLERERQSQSRLQASLRPPSAHRQPCTPPPGNDNRLTTSSSEPASASSARESLLKGTTTPQGTPCHMGSHVTGLLPVDSAACIESPSSKTSGADWGKRTQLGGTNRSSSTKTFVFQTPQNYTIPVFQPINIKDAPRMYYRPWKGDKLPVADVTRPQTSPPFY